LPSGFFYVSFAIINTQEEGNILSNVNDDSPEAAGVSAESPKPKPNYTTFISTIRQKQPRSIFSTEVADDQAADEFRGQREHIIAEINSFLAKEPGSADQLVKRIKSLIRNHYPASEYLDNPVWTEADLEDRVQDIWETMFSPENTAFRNLAQIDAAGMLNIMRGVIRRVLEKHANPAHRAFYNEIVEQIGDDDRFDRYPRHGKAIYLGLTRWNRTGKDSSKTVDELVSFWKESGIKFPDMCLTFLKAGQRMDLCCEMLDKLDRWLVANHFYLAYKRLVNYPLSFIPDHYSDNDDDDGEYDISYLVFSKKRFWVEQEAQRILAENCDAWEKDFDEITKKWDKTRKEFLYYYYVRGIDAGQAADRVGMRPSYATQTFSSIKSSFKERSIKYSREEMAAYMLFFKVYAERFSPAKGGDAE